MGKFVNLGLSEVTHVERWSKYADGNVVACLSQHGDRLEMVQRLHVHVIHL